MARYRAKREGELYDFQDGLGAVFDSCYAEEHSHCLGNAALTSDDLPLVFVGHL